jgi:hypothetical protein
LALIVCGLPLAVSVDVVHWALPALTAVAEQIVVDPSVNVTVPALPGLGDTVAVNVTEPPNVLVLPGLELVTAVVVVWVACLKCA